MTPEELTAEADRIAELRNDARTPAVVRRACLVPGGLTLRQYLALEDAASPVVVGRWPDDAAELVQAFCIAWAIVWPGRDLPDADGMKKGMRDMRGLVERAFATAMEMRFPRPPGAPVSQDPPDGLGWVTRLLARYVRTGWAMADILDTPLDALLLLTAGMLSLDGAYSAGEDYRERLLVARIEGPMADVPVASEQVADEANQAVAEDKHENPGDHIVNVS